jgi:hypothetical protein
MRSFSSDYSLMRHIGYKKRDCPVAADKGGRDVSRRALMRLMTWHYDFAEMCVGPERAAAALERVRD